MTFDTLNLAKNKTSGSLIQTYRSMQLETISSKIYRELLNSFYGLSVAACNLSRYHSSVTVTQSIADFSGVDRARISFHRHSSLFQDHGVDRACRCVTYAFVVPRAFTPWTRRTHLESLIRRLTSRAFLNSPALFVPFLVSSPVPRSLCFFFLFIFANSFFSRLLKRRATGLGLATSSPALSTGSFLSLSSLPKASKLNGTHGYVIGRFWLRL